MISPLLQPDEEVRTLVISSAAALTLEDHRSSVTLPHASLAHRILNIAFLHGARIHVGNSEVHSTGKNAFELTMTIPSHQFPEQYSPHLDKLCPKCSKK